VTHPTHSPWGETELSGLEVSRPVYDWPTLHERIHCLRTRHPLTVDFVRHGESVANEMGLVAGARDVPLTHRGREQSHALGRSLTQRYTHAWSSTLGRSKETLLSILRGSQNHGARWYVDCRLNERHLGVLEGTVRTFVPEYASGDLEFAPPGGESYLDLAQRVLSFLVDLVDPVTGPATAGPILVSTHAGPLRVVHALFEGTTDGREMLALDVSNASMYRRVIQRLSWPLFLHNFDCGHAQAIRAVVRSNGGTRKT
jgi:broad specificity phosphatase PhoE